MITGVKPEKQKELREFMIAMAPLMSKTEQDGFGYAAFTDKGFYGEHWLANDDAFRYRQIWNKKDTEIRNEFQGALEGDPRYHCFMERPNVDYDKENVFAMILHARMATTPKALKNVHPFVRDGHVLIHNGMISNYQEKHLKLINSTCDSETILNSYIDRKVSSTMSNIDAVAQDLRGSYTCGLMTKDADGQPILDLFRHSNPLGACYIRELDALVFCTSIWLVQQACDKLKWKCGSFFHLKDDQMIRMNAKTGRFLAKHEFKSVTGNYAAAPGVWSKQQWDEFYSRNNITTPTESDDASNVDNTDSTNAGDVTEIGEGRFNQGSGELTADEKKMTPKQIEIMRKNGDTSLGGSVTEDDVTQEIILPENRNGKMVH